MVFGMRSPYLKLKKPALDALLDTGLTGWLAINNQDAQSLGWILETKNEFMDTASGEARFDIYQGTVFLDGQEYIVPVFGGDELQEILLGVNWLQLKRLVADFPTGVLTLLVT
ncbi:MAG: aspartyl protease [Scytonema sp. PMC 1069.18]|nr:aspartyl protease [Scytonema sp. PMC 1069.18]MEC4883297.1 aspartyl protease [Scytonema sp. PMC 1070.18]